MSELWKYEELNVEELLKKIDEKTANEMLKGFSHLFGFKIVEINGKVFTTAKELMKVFGYSDEKAVRKLLNEYDVETFEIQDVAQTEVQFPSAKSLISKVFGITHSPALSKLKLLDYRAFLVIALNSRTEKARLIKEYLIEMEREARQRIVLAQKGYTPEGLQEGQKALNDLVEEIKALKGEIRGLRETLKEKTVSFPVPKELEEVAKLLSEVLELEFEVKLPLEEAKEVLKREISQAFCFETEEDFKTYAPLVFRFLEKKREELSKRKKALLETLSRIKEMMTGEEDASGRC